MRYSAGHRGFTFLELVVASAITSVLLAAIVSAIMMASKALPESSPAGAMSDGIDALALITDDLAQAKTITRATARGVKITVADRTGDGADETIEYTWSGTRGAPILREINDAGTSDLLEHADALAFTYHTVVEGEASRNIQQSTAEQTVFSGIASTATAMTLNASNPYMESFKATLPAGATSWTIERFDVFISSSGTRSAGMVVALYELDLSLLPLGAPLVSVTVNETSLPSTFGWYSVPIGRVQGLIPNQTYAWIFTQAGGTSGDAATMAYVDISNAEGNARGSISRKLLLVWLANTSQRIACQMRGTATVSVTTPDTRRTVVKEIGVDLLATDALKTASAGVKLLNEPEAP